MGKCEVDMQKQIGNFMEQIKLPEEGKRCVLQYEMTKEIYQKWKSLFYENEQVFFQKLEKEQEKEQLILYLYVRFAIEIYPQYVKRGISDKIFWDTFSDFTIWYWHCVKEKKMIGLTEERWLKCHLKMKLFRLGRLQFELDEKKKQIHVHVPEGEPVSETACDDAFFQADKFFDQSYRTYDCESWLLSPALLEMLDENTSIIQFQKRFQIQKVNMHVRQAEERVFGEIREEKETYPERTSLQRALKDYILSGKNPGVGFGVIDR